MRATFVTYILISVFSKEKTGGKVKGRCGCSVGAWWPVAATGNVLKGRFQCLSHGQHRLKDTVFTLCLRLLQVRQGWSKAFQRKA